MVLITSFVTKHISNLTYNTSYKSNKNIGSIRKLLLLNFLFQLMLSTAFTLHETTNSIKIAFSELNLYCKTYIVINLE